MHARGRKEQSKMKSSSYVSWHEKRVCVSVFPHMKRERIRTSAGIFEEEHGSEQRGRAHHIPPDRGLVPPCQPHGTWMGNLMEEVADAVKLSVASTSKSHLQTSHAELGDLRCHLGTGSLSPAAALCIV